MTFLLTAEVDGEPLSDAERLGIAQLLLIAGIDTTANTLAHALLYFSENAEARKRLAGDRLLMTTAVEEFLRIYAPVSLVRGARTDTEVAGCPIPAGNPGLPLDPVGQPRRAPIQRCRRDRAGS